MPKKQKDILVKDKQKIGRPKRYKVVFYNDDFTPMNLVTLILMEVFKKGEQEARSIMETYLLWRHIRMWTVTCTVHIPHRIRWASRGDNALCIKACAFRTLPMFFGVCPSIGYRFDIRGEVYRSEGTVGNK